MKKTLIVGCVLVFAGLAVLLYGCDNRPSPAKSVEEKPVAAPPETSSESKAGTVGSVVDYATGETPLRIKNRKTDQIKKIEESQKSKYDE